MTLKTADDLAALTAEARRLEAMGRLTRMNVRPWIWMQWRRFGNRNRAGKFAPNRRNGSNANCHSRRGSARRKWTPSLARKQPPALEDEFVVVQGVADLVVVLPGEIWLVDFKTDELKSGELTGRRRAL